jgi:hypothetical protein
MTDCDCIECDEPINEGQDEATLCGSVHEWCEDTHTTRIARNAGGTNHERSSGNQAPGNPGAV